jgi:hypothetical protein
MSLKYHWHASPVMLVLSCHIDTLHVGTLYVDTLDYTDSFPGKSGHHLCSCYTNVTGSVP